MTAIVVMAKAPVPGRVKTRLTPALTPEQAAALAAAALADTLAAVRAVDAATRRILCLDGAPGDWAEGFEVLAQRGTNGLASRLAAMAVDVGEPFLVVGMDTPQLTPALLRTALRAPGDAAIGPATDGGYWGLRLDEPDPRAFDGVPMSRSDTGALQRARLRQLGLSVTELPALQDVDRVEDAAAVARAAPRSRFARAWAALRPRPTPLPLPSISAPLP